MLVDVTTIGARRRRVEDERLVTGRGRYAADEWPAGLCHLALLRSPYPHARIDRIDTETARAVPGVLAVWTAADLGEMRFMPRPPFPPPPPLDDLRLTPVLPGDETCYEGQALAAVIAESAEAAADALEALMLGLEPLAGVGGAACAIAPGAAVAHEGASGNVAGSTILEAGDIAGAFDGAPVTVQATLRLARVCGAAMEPRSVTAEPEPDGGLLLRTSTQSVFGVREAVALALGVEEGRVRVEIGSAHV